MVSLEKRKQVISFVLTHERTFIDMHLAHVEVFSRLKVYEYTYKIAYTQMHISIIYYPILLLFLSNLS